MSQMRGLECLRQGVNRRLRRWERGEMEILVKLKLTLKLGVFGIATILTCYSKIGTIITQTLG